jgi:predicted phosphodiesterase
MQVAVISDIHSNLPALTAVLTDIEGAQPAPDAIWCLGDVVGYGASPDACTALTANLADVCLAGNHDLVIRGEIDISAFTTSAEAAARWTMKTINAKTREFLAELRPLERGHAAGMYHASPRDPVWEYVLSTGQAHECLETQPDRVCLIGHSHVACFFFRNGGGTEGAMARGGTVLELSEGKWLVNPGSVGQPRDGDPRAAWMLLDTEEWTAEFRRVEYPIEEAASAIVAAELPRQLADRLFLGQ